MYNQVLELRTELEDKRGLSFTNINLSGPYTLKEDYIKALEYARRSLELREEIGFRTGISRSLAVMGNCQVNLGNYNVGLPLLKRSLAIATETGSVDELSAVYRSLAKCYEKMGNYRLALGHQKSWEHILDSLFTVDQNKQLANTQTFYETEKKEKLIIE